MANIARDIFKAYDIRGIVGKTLTFNRMNDAIFNQQQINGKLCFMF